MAPCARCGSTRWRRAPGGTRVCEEGHVDMSYRRETIDTGANAASLRIRREHRPRVRKSRQNDAVYWGKEAAYHHYELVVQLVRHQVRALSTLWSLPPSFELAVRELLALELEGRHLPPVPGALVSEQRNGGDEVGSRGGGEQTGARPGGAVAAVAAAAAGAESPKQSPRKRGFDEDGVGEGSQTDGGGRISSSSDTESDADDDNDEAVRRAVEADHASSSSSSSSSSASDNDGDAPPQASNPRKHKPRRPPADGLQRGRLGPTTALALVLLGARAVRAPFLLSEVVHLVNSRQVPFIDYAHSDLVPADVRAHFNAYVYSALSPKNAPTAAGLHEAMRKLAKRFERRFGLVLPEPNAAPVLWTCCRSLGLSPVWYPLAKQVAAQLDLEFSLTGSADIDDEPRHPNPRHADGLAPELALLCACIIAVKLVYFQQGGQQHSSSSSSSKVGGKSRRSADNGAAAAWAAVEGGSSSFTSGPGDAGKATEDGPEVGEGVLTRAEWLALARQMLETVEGKIDHSRLASGDFDPLELGQDELDAYLALAPALLADGRAKPKAYDTLAALPLPPVPAAAPGSSASISSVLATAAGLMPAAYRTAATARAKMGLPLPPSFPPSISSSSSTNVAAIAVSDADDKRTYPVFVPDDTTGVLPPRLATLVTLGAHTVGFSSEAVIRALGTLERRLVRKEEAERAVRRRETRDAAQGDEAVNDEREQGEMDDVS